MPASWNSSALASRINRDPRVQGITDPNERLRALQGYDATALARSQGRWNTADKFAWGATTIPLAGLASAGFAGAGGASATLPAAATEGVGFDAAPAAASAAHGLPWMRLGELGTGLFTNYMGNRSQNAAYNREFTYRTQADQRAYEMAQAQEVERVREWTAQQAAAEKAFQAQQEQARLDRAEEARRAAIDEAYMAANEGRNVAREAQRGPYRQAGQIALRDLVSGLR